MGSPSESQFLHRAYLDGTFESICKECFHSVAREKREVDLQAIELKHVCDPRTRIRQRLRDNDPDFGP